MSLINKMLRDLESREQQVPNAIPPQRPVYQDLKPTTRRRTAAIAPIVLVLVGSSAVTVAGYYAWDAWRGGAFDASTTVSVPAPKPTAQSSAPSPATSPLPASTVAATPDPAGAIQLVPATPATEPASVVASIAPSPAVTPAPLPAPPIESEIKEQATVPKAEAPAVRAPAPATIAVAKPVKPKPAAAPPAADDAAGSFDKRIRPFTPEEKAEGGYRAALRYLDQGRQDDASRELTQALRVDPGHAATRELLVALSLKRGHWREAQRLLEDGLKQAPNRYSFAQLLARIHVDRGADQEALAVLERALPNAANDSEFKALLATVYQRVGRHADAVTTFAQVTALQPADSRAWLGLGISLEAKQKTQAAKQAYERARQMGGLPPSLTKYAEQRLAALRSID